MQTAVADQQTPSPAPRAADATDLLDGRLAAEMPAAVPAVVEGDPSPPDRPAAGSAATSTAPPRDADGRLYDVNLHETDSAGNPVFRADGVTLRCRRTPLKAAATTSSAPQSPKPAAAVGAGPVPAGPAAVAAVVVEVVSPEEQARRDQAYKDLGATFAGMQLQLMAAAIGDEGVSKDSKAGLAASWSMCCERWQWHQFHPLMAVGMSTFAIVRETLAEPKNEPKRASFIVRAKHQGERLWLWWRQKRQSKSPAKPVAPMAGEIPLP